ncbi:MAG: aminotransferase class I/II-fold pyridoxal phosphate-dependent enzyme [Actinomycetia bacterium]|nr:aminotransferase class I/II-fold pyridoxal phosphate-dependent enzyme [Actinomycetes bacterium]
MPLTPPLSERGDGLASRSPMPEYIAQHFARVDDDGYTGLAISENKLVWDLLEPRLNSNRAVPSSAIGYDDMAGSLDFRTAVAQFASEHVWGRDVDADKVVVLAGAGSILETLFYAIADPGDAILVPTPSYAGFWADIETRDKLHIVEVPTSSDESFALTAERLQAAYDISPWPVRALLITNPSNPTGRIHTDSEIQEAVTWARSVGIHIVMNEVYALSVLGATSFVPSGRIVDPDQGDIHFVWAFSKDFAMSGMRCGVLTTANEGVRAAVTNLAYWSLVSGDTQHFLGSLLRDSEWVDMYVATMQSRLAASYTATTAALEAAGISYIPADAGLFVLLDMREFLSEPTWHAEQDLWDTVFNDADVNLTPGSACHIDEPGFMRLCFAVAPADIVVAAIGRIHKVLKN